MEVKSVYMDLQEGVKKGNVWKLESEAFKKPIEIKIGYENKELAEFNNRFEGIEKSIKLLGTNLNHGTDLRVYMAGQIKELQDKQKMQEGAVAKLNEKIENQNGEISSLYKVIADLKTTVETLSGTILHLQEQTKLLEKKTTKQPSVFHDKCFISGHESAGLGMFNLEDGDYLLTMNIKIGEHNEFVTNKDELIMDKVHVENQTYVPFYKLEGGTELDVPTATIYYDLVFMPI